jgi:hypothetical protein
LVTLRVSLLRVMIIPSKSAILPMCDVAKVKAHTIVGW